MYVCHLFYFFSMLKILSLCQKILVLCHHIVQNIDQQVFFIIFNYFSIAVDTQQLHSFQLRDVRSALELLQDVLRQYYCQFTCNIDKDGMCTEQLYIKTKYSTEDQNASKQIQTSTLLTMNKCHHQLSKLISWPRPHCKITVTIPNQWPP